MYLGHDVSMKDFYMVQPLIVVIATIFFPIGMSMSKLYGSRTIIAAGGFSSIGSVFLCSFIKHPIVFCLLYSLAFGVGKGFMYSSALRAAWSHLPGRKGCVSGLVISGFGFGGFFFGIITNALANPDNEKAIAFEIAPGVEEYFFTGSVAEGVPSMLRKLCLIWVSLLIFGLLTIREYTPGSSDDVFYSGDADEE